MNTIVSFNLKKNIENSYETCLHVHHYQHRVPPTSQKCKNSRSFFSLLDRKF